MTLSRRDFLATVLATPLASAAGHPSWQRPQGAVLTDALRAELGFPIPHRLWHGESSVAAALRTTPGQARERRLDRHAEFTRKRPDAVRRSYFEGFPDLRRHFVFEYYPWYGINPWIHWDEAERRPPHDIAATSYPLLGPYDSRDVKVLEQHARWMASAGVGAINVSWWGRGTWMDDAMPALMDVMRAHDIHVTFHLEPYQNNRGENYVSDVLYLLDRYGERRRWDVLLLL